ncbi:MAG: DUF6446 family protein, partial [Pseudomonadota bacterium]
MTGKLLVLVLVLSTVLAGGALYYLQVYAYYSEVPVAADGENLHLVAAATEAPEVVETADFRAIDADSSPIRYRACFTTKIPLVDLKARFKVMPKGNPRNAPSWFDCFDAVAVGQQIERGTATVFLSQKNIEYGVDRIAAITEDGRGFVWHELNECGKKAYDGTVVGEACPPRPEQ